MGAWDCQILAFGFYWYFTQHRNILEPTFHRHVHRCSGAEKPTQSMKCRENKSVLVLLKWCVQHFIVWLCESMLEDWFQFSSFNMCDTVCSPAMFPFCLVCRISELGMEIQKWCQPTWAVSKLMILDSLHSAQKIRSRMLFIFLLLNL